MLSRNFFKIKTLLSLRTQHKLALECIRHLSSELERKYSDNDKQKILDVMNSTDDQTLSQYEITKTRLKKFSVWKTNNGHVESLSDVELIDGFTSKTAKKLFDSILVGPKVKSLNLSNKIKGQILQPMLSESVRQSCKTVLAVYVAANSVSWTHITKDNYEVIEWKYHGINYPEGKKLQITDILSIAWSVSGVLPAADVYVMKGEATSVRAPGSDPNNPKLIAVNLQKAQMVSMIVALIHAREHRVEFSDSEDDENKSKEAEFKHKVYFLRPTLPYRLYGTLVGNERVSTDQTTEMLLQQSAVRPDDSHVLVSAALCDAYRAHNELQKDMLGHCLFLALTFMDLCIYRNRSSIEKLLKKGE